VRQVDLASFEGLVPKGADWRQFTTRARQSQAAE